MLSGLHDAVAHGEFAHAITLLRDPSRPRGESECCLAAELLQVFWRACLPGSAVAEARRAAIVAAGAVSLAADVLRAELGGCAPACDAACVLLIAASHGRGCVAEAAAANARDAVLGLFACVASAVASAVADARSDSQRRWLGAAGSPTALKMQRRSLEALLALAGLEVGDTPHAGAAARAAIFGESPAAVAAADALLLAAVTVVPVCVAWAAQLCERVVAWEKEGEDALVSHAWATLRVAGHTFRAALRVATPAERAAALTLLTQKVAASLENELLCWWALTYAFLPLAYSELRPAHAAASHARVFFCRLRCCAPHGAGPARRTLDELRAAGALPLLCTLLRTQASCLRPGCRLLSLLCVGNTDAAAIQFGHDACDALGATSETWHDGSGDNSRGALNAATRAHLDAGYEYGEDGDAEGGEGLSDWGSSNDERGKATRMPTRTLVGRALRDTICAEALANAMALRGREAAAAAASAELLAEEERDAGTRAKAPGAAGGSKGGKGTKSKSKSKSKPKKPAAARAAPVVAAAAAASEDDEAAHGASDGDEDGEGAVEEEDMARLLRPPPAAVAARARAGRQTAPAPPAAPQQRPAPHAPPPPPPPPPPQQQQQQRRRQEPHAPPRPPPQQEQPARSLRPEAALPLPAPLPLPLPLPPPAAASHGDAGEAHPPVTSDEALAAIFPWMALHHDAPRPPAPRQQPQQQLASAADAPHEDDGLCVCCLDAPRDTALPGCAGAHPPAVCAACATLLLHAAAPACPLCRAPLAG